jgi:hypothetical protein
VACTRQGAETAVRSQVIVVVTPCLDGFARLGEVKEDVIVEAFVAKFGWDHPITKEADLPFLHGPHHGSFCSCDYLASVRTSLRQRVLVFGDFPLSWPKYGAVAASFRCLAAPEKGTFR